MASYDVVDLIRSKRDGGVLADEEIRWLIDAYTRGDVGDEQMSALAMAIFFRGLDARELPTWTRAMIDTGERLDFSGLSRPTADKHSTGGVGDKITLPLAPLVAACGVAVPQLSGRGLGHTGGTLDKLEAIPGWRAMLSNEEMLAQLEDVGAVICGAGSGLAPADKKLYALRDVTGTVEAIPLIASSIMSKKIAEGTGALVLDVKTGAGAFMKTLDASRELARTMVGLGAAAGVTGRGTGIDDAMLAHKVAVVERALALHTPSVSDPVGVVAAVGGLEHAATVGLILGAAELRVPVVLDGVISVSSALVAAALAPASVDVLIAGHRSAEPGSATALSALGLTPLLDLGMRLGEGSGGVLAYPLVVAAARVLREVATFDDAGVSEA